MNMGSAGLYPHIVQYRAPSLLVPALALTPHLCFCALLRFCGFRGQTDCEIILQFLTTLK